MPHSPSNQKGKEGSHKTFGNLKKFAENKKKTKTVLEENNNKISHHSEHGTIQAMFGWCSLVL